MKISIAACAVALLPVTAAAQDIGDTTVSLGASTFGANLEAAYQLDSQWRVRGALMGGINYDDTSEEDGNEYNIDASLGAFAVLADYYPTMSGWRISGGILVNRTSLDATASATSDDPIDIDGTEYSEGNVTLSGDFSKTVSPMITTGYDYRFNNAWSLSGEIGVVYTGGIDLDARGSTTELQNAIDDSQDFQDIRSDASDLDFYPYISVTVGYSF
ncbi:MAG: hypothetical protein R6V30_13250 [Paracoccaceae bacterium]